MTDYQNIITINPEKRFGKPCIRDTRISVFDVLSWLASGMPREDIQIDFPEITEEDISSLFRKVCHLPSGRASRLIESTNLNS